MVFAAPPCSTFSVARLQISNGPPQLRSRMHPRGIPGLPPPDQEQVERHNDLVGVMLSLMTAAAKAGASLAIENPVPRGDPSSRFYQTGLSDHASLWDLPEVMAMMKGAYMISIDFPQCALQANFQKYTRLAFTYDLRPMLNRLSSLRCGHRTHVSIANGFDGRGNSLGHQSAMYPPAMSALLAQTFATAVFDRRNKEMQTVVAPAVRVDMPSDGLPTPVPAPRAPHVIMKQMHIDTMAPYGVTSTPSAIVRVQELHPGISLAGVSGTIPIVAVVTIGFHVRRESNDERWIYLEIPDCYYAPESTIELYPVQHCFELLGWRHQFDDVCSISIQHGYVIPFVSESGRGYHMKVAYDMRRLARLPLSLRSPAPRRRSDGTGTATALAFPSVPVLQVGDKPREVDLVWRRLGYPSSEIWRHVHTATLNSGLTSSSQSPTYTSSDERLAVARGRMRAGAFPRSHADDPATEPLYKVYMDFAGPMGVPSFIHGYRHFCGVVDGYSGFGLAFACRAPTGAVAVSALKQFLIVSRVLLKSATPVTPVIVRTDQGSAFMGSVFPEYVRSLNSQHSPSVAYAPQQNSVIERAWGSIFNIARVLLHAANLSPVWHAYAVKMAAYLRNVHPRSKNGLTRHGMFCRVSPDLRYLRAFGCSVEAYLGKEQRYASDKRRELPLGKKLVDHAAAGIYLGPAYPTPGHLVYFPKKRVIQACVHVSFDETTYPGVAETPIRDDADAQDMSPQMITHELTPPATLPTVAPPAMLPTPRPTAPTPRLSPSVDPAEPLPFVLQPPPVLIPPTARPVMAGGRVHPLRDGRTGPFGYTDPTASTRAQAEDNFAILSTLVTRVAPAFAYQSPVGSATVVRPSFDPGELKIPTSYGAAMASPEAEYWRAAIVAELSGLLERQTWVVVPMSTMPEGSNLMNCHMIFSIKRDADGSIKKFKARLVADGQTQRHGVDFDRVFATVVKMSTVRFLLAVAVMNKMNLSSLDVVQAYLHAELDRPLYMRVPPGLVRTDADGNRLVCELHKSLYGLRQAAREWNTLFVTFLVQWGFVQSAADTCLFFLVRVTLVMIIVIWVDDIICADSDTALRDKFASDLAKKFPVEEKTELTWVLGIRVQHDLASGMLTMSQELYVKDMLRRYAPHMATTGRRFDSPMADDVTYSPDQCPAPGSQEADDMAPLKETYMSVVGALLWLAACTRPDLTYTTSILARFVSNPARIHYVAMQRVLAYLHTTTDCNLILRPGTKLGVVVYTDSSWDEKFSVSGGVIFYEGCMIVWYSRRQRTVSHSSAEAEYIAASLAAREGAHIRAVASELGLLPPGPTRLRIDNKSAIDMAHDPVAFKKTKHIMRESHYLRDLVARRVYAPEHVVSSDNLADILTKALPRLTFVRLRGFLLQLAAV